MPRCVVGTEIGSAINIDYEDQGSDQPVVPIHGYPLNADPWERQERELLAADHRVIRYDRCGFGRVARASRPSATTTTRSPPT